MSANVLRFEKVKSKNMFTKMYKHNMRIDYCENVDKSRSYLNEEIIPLPEGETYKSAFEKMIKSSEYYKEHSVRKNAVFAIDVQITFGEEKMNDPTFDVEEWKERAKQWTIDTFGEENVISMALHKDEKTPHIHAIVIPMVEGKLNCSHFIGSPEKLTQMHDSMATYMQDFGLERGTKGSKARHVPPKVYRGEREKFVSKSLPEPLQNETVTAYQERALAHLQDYLLSLQEELRKLKADSMAKETQKAEVERLQKEIKDLSEQNERLKETVEKAKKSLDNAQRNQRLFNSVIYAINNGLLPEGESEEFKRKFMECAKIGEAAMAEKSKKNEQNI